MCLKRSGTESRWDLTHFVRFDWNWLIYKKIYFKRTGKRSQKVKQNSHYHSFNSKPKEWMPVTKLLSVLADRSVERALLVQQAAKVLQCQCPSAQQCFSWHVWQLHTHCCISKTKLVKFDLYWNMESIFSLKLVSINNTVELWCTAPPSLLSNTGLHLQNKWLSKGLSPSCRVFLIVWVSYQEFASTKYILEISSFLLFSLIKEIRKILVFSFSVHCALVVMDKAHMLPASCLFLGA